MTAAGRAPDLSPMEAAIVARFEAAEPAPESYRATTDPLDVLQAAVEPTSTDELTRHHFGWWIEVPARQAAGYLYVIRDEYHDGYPSRYLVLVDEDGNAVEEQFSDSNPAGYPKTLATPCMARPTGPQPVAGQLALGSFGGQQ